MDEKERVVEVRASSAMLWTGILAGPIAWLLDVQINYALLQWACLNHADWVLWAVTVIMLVMCIFAAFEARRGMALDPSRRALFMGLGGLIISGSFFLAILSTSAALAFLKPCD